MTPRRFATLLACAFLASCVMTPDRPPTPDRRVFFAEGEAIEAARGEEVSVRLPGNATTGFRWRLMEKPDFVQVVAERYESDIETTGRVGAGGAAVFILRADAPGDGVLTFEYARPRDTGPDREADYRTIRYTVR